MDYLTFTLTMQVTQYRVQRLRHAYSFNYFLYVGSLFKEDSSNSQYIGSNGRIPYYLLVIPELGTMWKEATG